MTLSKIFEQGKYLNYSVLATKVSITLRKIKAGNRINEIEQNILRRGAHLIQKIIEGAALSEGSFQENLTHTQESVSAYGYALYVLDEISPLIEADYTSFFRKLKVELNRNISKKSIQKKVNSGIDIDLLINFFSTLSSFFRREAQEENYGTPENSIIFLEKKRFNEYQTETAS